MSSVSRSVGRPVARSVLAGQLNTLASIIKSLFANSEQGFAYDPNDLTTLYQDAAGTIPVTAAGQPVGLMLDKSGRNNHAYQNTSSMRPVLRQVPILGENKLPTLDFNTWSGQVGIGTTFTSNSITVTDSAGGRILDGLFVVGKTYKLTAKFTTTSASFRFINNSYGASPEIANTTSGHVETLFTAINTPLYIRLSVGTINFSLLKIEEVTGYDTTKNYLDYDGIDDKLVTSFQAPLTNATIVRAVPNVGTQILTGQSIPATYEDSTDHCGLIVINRALTPSETSAITTEFNKRAGV